MCLRVIYGRFSLLLMCLLTTSGSSLSPVRLRCMSSGTDTCGFGRSGSWTGWGRTLCIRRDQTGVPSLGWESTVVFPEEVRTGFPEEVRKDM